MAVLCLWYTAHESQHEYLRLLLQARCRAPMYRHFATEPTIEGLALADPSHFCFGHMRIVRFSGLLRLLQATSSALTNALALYEQWKLLTTKGYRPQTIHSQGRVMKYRTMRC